MKNKTLVKILTAISSAVFASGGLAVNYSSSPMSVCAGDGFGTDVVEITDGENFAKTINNATDGLLIKVMNDISYSEKIVVPENCFVTVEMNGHTIFYTSNSPDNLGAQLTSTIMLQNGTWSGTIDTDNWASGTIILNNFRQILPEGEEDLISEGTDCNPKGLIFLGSTNMWIVNGSSVHRISTESGHINPGAENLNPWGPHHQNPEETEIELSIKQPYNFENPAPAMVGSGTTWEVKATLNEDFQRAQTGGETYKHVILLKDSSLTESATFEAADKIFDLAGHSLSLGEYELNVANESGRNIIRNGSLDGDIDLSVGAGDVELASLETPGTINNNAHNVTIDGGHYSNVTTDSGMVYLKNGYFAGTYSGTKFEMFGGYFVNRPEASQITLGSEVAECSVLEKGTTYNYEVADTQPNKGNDYTAAVNDTVPGASFQWYKKEVTKVLLDDNYYTYIEVGKVVSPGNYTTEYYSWNEKYCLALELDRDIFSAGDVITFKCDAELEVYDDDMGQITNIGSEYTYALSSYYGYFYFAILTEEEVSVYDMKVSVVTDAPIEGETNARLGDIALEKTEYFCKTYKNGDLIKTSIHIVPNAIAFTCATEGASGDNPDTLYQLEGRSIALPDNPYTKACCGFDGWYEGSTKIEGCTYIVGASDVELTAKLEYGYHTYSDEWSSNETHHWHAATCEHTDEKSAYGEHDWDEGVIIIQPSEQTKGSKKFTCTVCAKTKTEDIGELSHEKGDHHDAVAKTCTTDGSLEYWDCKNCGKKLDADGNVLDSIIVPSTGHNATKIEAKEPQAGEAGHKEYFECTECHEYFEDQSCTVAIPDLASWLREGGNGYVAPVKPEEKNPLTWLWIALAILLLLVVFYFLGYFLLYRKGLLDDKPIQVIYKWLPRGGKNPKNIN